MNRFSHYQANIKTSTLFKANSSPKTVCLRSYINSRNEENKIAQNANEPTG